MESAYLETTFISYLVARPSREQWSVRSWAIESARPTNSWKHSIMSEGPIVAEVHHTREKLAAEYNLDVTAYFAGLRKRQAALGGRLIHQKTHAEPTTEPDPSRHSDSSQSAPSGASPAA